MPSVMIRRGRNGGLMLYIAKKDLEEPIASLQHEGPGRWGGELTLGDGSRYYLEPLAEPPRLPITLRAKRM